jgi:hypothetical protein
MASTTENPESKLLEQATERLADAQAEFDRALYALLNSGRRGSQAAAARITGLTREALRLRQRAQQQNESAA